MDKTRAFRILAAAIPSAMWPAEDRSVLVYLDTMEIQPTIAKGESALIATTVLDRARAATIAVWTCALASAV